MDKSLIMWVTFIGVVVILLVLDLGVFNKKDHEIGVKESILLSSFYITMALLFAGWVWYKLGLQAFEEYLTGYLVEKSLSLDNIFVISIIFKHLHIPSLYQHRVLFWGIIGVVILRALMIGLGATLVSKFSWILYIFAVFLIFTGIKMLFAKENRDDLGQNKLLTFFKKHIRVTNQIKSNHFFEMRTDDKTKSKQLWCTPLFIALLMVECTDLLFAVDSVPAIFAITTDTYIIYTSNIFAVLGLRALYFALAALLPRFVYLKYALSLILIFIGSKIFVADLFNWNKFPTSISLWVTLGLLAAGIMLSIYREKILQILGNLKK